MATIRDIIDTIKHTSISELAKDLKDVILNLPSIVLNIAKRVAEEYKKMSTLDGYPLVNEIRKLVERIASFIGDIQDDILGFYHVCITYIALKLGKLW